MRSKGNTLIELRYKPRKKTSWTFFRKVQISLTLALIGSFLLIGGAIVIRQYADIKHQLQLQGDVLTLNLAYNAEPFIVDYDKDQLNQLLDATLSNPLVLFSGIINTRYSKPSIDVLKKQASVNLKFVTDVIRQPDYQKIKMPRSVDVNAQAHGIRHVIYCISPIFSDFKFPDDETTLLYNQPKHKGIIGYSVMAYRMPWDQLFSVNIKWVSLIFVLVSCILGYVLGKLIAYQFTKRINAIHQALLGYSFGDILKLEDNGSDEISDISNAIQGLTELVTVQLNKIKATNQTLEKTIQERIQEIHDLNQRIERFSHNQRAFFAQTAQEVQSLIKMITMVKGKTKTLVFYHVNAVMDRMINMGKHNQLFMAPGRVDSIDVNQCMEELKPLFEALSKQNNNVLKISLSGTIILQTDGVQLRQSLIQLMNSASKYTASGQINWSITCDDRHVFFKVSDTGVGMDQDRVNKVLTQLDQTDMPLIDAFSTLGLGLVLIHRFCRDHQAKLICQSQKNKGTTIEIIHPKLSKGSGISTNNLLCLSNNQALLSDIKQMIQVIPSWDCHQFESLEMIQADLLHTVLIDLDWSDSMKVFNKIQQLHPSIQAILYYRSSFIAASKVIKMNDLKMVAAIKKSLMDAPKNIGAHGLPDDIVKKISDKLGIPVSSTFDYRAKNSIKLVGESAILMNVKPVHAWLIYKSHSSLIKAIQSKGWGIEQLPTLAIFK